MLAVEIDYADRPPAGDQRSYERDEPRRRTPDEWNGKYRHRQYEREPSSGGAAAREHGSCSEHRHGREERFHRTTILPRAAERPLHHRSFTATVSIFAEPRLVLRALAAGTMYSSKSDGPSDDRAISSGQGERIPTSSSGLFRRGRE